MPVQDADSGVASEEEVHSLTDVTCNCELCQARQYVAARQKLEDECSGVLEQTIDGFHLLPTSKAMQPTSPHYAMPLVYPWTYPMPFYPDFATYIYTNYNKNTLPPGIDKAARNGLNMTNPIGEIPCRTNMGSLTFETEQDNHVMQSNPQVYISKDCVLHIKLSSYVSFERSVSAYRLINYRNNSALALNESGEYGYAYHYNCRGLINMHHGKLSVKFDKDRQVLLRSEKPSFVKKENEFYRLTAHHWTACRPVSMDTFDRDRTPEILKKLGNEKSLDESKLRELVSTSAVHKDGGSLIGDAKIEQKVNGDVVLSWFYEDRCNSLIVSPLSGSFSLSTKNLEMMATPKADIYIAFADFFVHVGGQQMTVSSGAIAGRCQVAKSHPCLLKLNTINVEQQTPEVRQYCAYSQVQSGSQNNHYSHNHHHHHHNYHHRRQTPIVSNPANTNLYSRGSSLSQNSIELKTDRKEENGTPSESVE